MRTTTKPAKRNRYAEVSWSCRLTCSRVAQIFHPSVSPRTVASRDDFSERGCVRSTSRSTPANPTRCGWVFDHSRGPCCSVSQNCILRTVEARRKFGKVGRSADYKSAIRQSSTLRYVGSLYARVRRFCFFVATTNFAKL